MAPGATATATFSPMKRRTPILSGVFACLLALTACGGDSGGDSGNARDEAVKNMLNSAGDNEALRPCFVDVLSPYDDATVAKMIDGNPGEEVRIAVDAGFNACVDNAPPTTLDVSGIDDPDLAALVADPVGWMQARWDGITTAMCNNDSAGLLELVSSTSANLDAFTSQLGTCSVVTVTGIRTRYDGTGPDDYILSDQLQFYVTDAGWNGDDHEWSAHFVLEDGRWKLLNN